MSKSDPRLAGVKPVNRTPRKAPTMTKKEEADARHQTMYDRRKHATYGMPSIPAETIEKQLALGRGSFCPENLMSQETDELQADSETLKAALGRKPSSPTPHSIYGPNPPTPFQFLQQKDGSVMEADVMNSVELALGKSRTGSKMASIDNLSKSIILKITAEHTFHDDRAVAFVEYFTWLTKKISEARTMGKKYGKEIVEWKRRKALSDAATALYLAQANWDATLSDGQRRLISQTARVDQLEQSMAEIIEHKVQEALQARDKAVAGESV
jgi:hypothetical protein